MLQRIKTYKGVKLFLCLIKAESSTHAGVTLEGYDMRAQQSLSSYGYDVPICLGPQRGTKNMATLAEAAKNYTAPQTKVVSDLDKLSTQLEIFEKTAENSDGEPFSYKFVVVDDVEYRVPGPVLSQMQTLLENDANLLYVKVIKKGEGRKSTYQVIPVKE